MSQNQDLPPGETLAFLQGVYNSADIGICVTDQDRCFVMVNEAYCLTYGYRREELIGEPFTRVLPEELRESAAKMHDEFLAGGDESAGEWRVRHKDGRIREVLVTAGRVNTDDGRRFKVSTVLDVTELRAKESRLEKLSQVVERTHHGVIFTDVDGLVTWVNQGAERISGYTLREMAGRKPGDVLQGEKSDPDTVLHMHRQLKAGEGFQVEIINYSKTGREYWNHVACSPVMDRHGQLEGFMALQTDVTEKKHFQERIQQLSFRDELTGLPNRRLVEEQLRYSMAISQHSGQHSALLFLDLDNFKVINETLGHRQGDDLLVWVAQTLTDTVDDSDLVARLGGDEFLIVLGDLPSDPADAAREVERVAEKILSALDKPFGEKQLEHRVTASLGALLFIGQDQSIGELMQQSDIAMYQAKSAGKNTFAFFDPAVQSEQLQRHRLEVELRGAIRSHQLVPFYQGQVDADGRLMSAELLLRWQHPVRGLLPPSEFIPFAEASELIVELGEEVMRLAAKQLILWGQDERTRDLTISVNISAKHFESPDFVEKVAAILTEFPLRPTTLKLEITESALADNLETIRDRMMALRALGISLSLDDFGTGYSSLAYLKRLPIGQVKIDQGFVRDLLVDENDRGITEAIIALARTLKMDVVAEGVETAAHRDLLLQLGCPIFQGYFFDRPASIADFSRRYQLR